MFERSLLATVNRRRFLAAAAVGASTATAGCGIISETTRLASPTVQSDDEGKETHLVFEDDGQRVAELSLDQQSEPEASSDPFKLRVHLSHRSSETRYDNPTSVTGFRFDLRTAPTSNHPPAAIYMQAPRTEFADVIEFEHIEGEWTRIAADDPGRLGDGTINIETIVSPEGDLADELDFRATVTLTEPGFTGTTYKLDAQTSFSPVRRS